MLPPLLVFHKHRHSRYQACKHGRAHRGHHSSRIPPNFLQPFLLFKLERNSQACWHAWFSTMWPTREKCVSLLLVFPSQIQCWSSFLYRSCLLSFSTTVYEEEEDPSNKSFFSEIISSVSDVKFSRDGRYILSRDYLTLRIWDINMDSKPLQTINVHDHLRPKLCDLYENDCIFDKFECTWSGDGEWAPLDVLSLIGFFSTTTDPFALPYLADMFSPAHTITTSTSTTKMLKRTLYCKPTSQHSKLRKLVDRRTRDSTQKVEPKEQTVLRHLLMLIILISTRRYCMRLGILKKIQLQSQLRTICSYLPNRAQVRKEHLRIPQLALLSCANQYYSLNNHFFRAFHQESQS